MLAAGVPSVKTPATGLITLGGVDQRQPCRQNVCKRESVHRPTRGSQAQGLVVDHRVTQSTELASDMSESHAISRNKHHADEWERSTHQDALPKRSHRALGQPRV